MDAFARKHWHSECCIMWDLLKDALHFEWLLNCNPMMGNLSLLIRQYIEMT